MSETKSTFRECVFDSNSATQVHVVTILLMLHDLTTLANPDDSLRTIGPSQLGGGVHVSEGRAIFIDSIFVNNQVGWGNYAEIDEPGGGGVLSGEGSFDNCTMKYNVARGVGGVSYGAAEFTNCKFTGNEAINGGVAFATGTTSIEDCVLSEGVARPTEIEDFIAQGAAVYSDGGDIIVRRTVVEKFQSSGSSDDSSVAAFFVGGGAAAQFDYITWRDDNTIRAVASTNDATVLVRNSAGMFETDVQDATILSCTDQAMTKYCAVDHCSSTLVGIDCFCYPDGNKVDPDQQSCTNSPQMEMLTANFDQNVNKADANATVDVIFANKGGEVLNYVLRTNQTDAAAEWVASPRAGSVAGGEYRKVRLTVGLAPLQSREEPYTARFELFSNNSYDGTNSHHFDVRTFVRNVDPDATASQVDVTNAEQLTAGGKVTFAVTPVDKTGLIIRDDANILFDASLDAPGGADGVCGSLGYDAPTGVYLGECELPQQYYTGSVTLTVTFDGEAVGGIANHLTVSRCPEDFYRTVSGDCQACPDHATCAENSDVASIIPDAGYWRHSLESTKLRKCRFNSASCPGGVVTAGQDAYCDPKYTGPLCSQCSRNHFTSWTGDGGCSTCEGSQHHGPTIALALAVVALGALVALLSKKMLSTAFFGRLEKLYLLAKTKVMMLFFAAQARRGAI